ncbi:hypothetical protein NLG97_g3484 [Lecanicillium saksenae]|uniref:Uncharacterized protein n=1 Tax=Lecanicillium saksenae TaxID=468837 RepID=A0ACC1QXY9_9HYPO|nr:hypothetical protein NLG97_g3484 [Lecanicillium saksenae]
MGKDSHRKRSQSEAPSRSRSHNSGSSSRQSPSVSYSRGHYTPSRLSQVTNAGDLSDVETQTEALRNFSFSQSQSAEASNVPLTFDTLSAWLLQGGDLDSVDDSVLESLLSQYIGKKGERSKRTRYTPPKVVPPPAPVLDEIEEAEEEDGGVSLHEPPSSTARKKDKGKGKAR